jgi:hypothetical protein
MSKWMKNKEALFQQFKEKKTKESEMTGVERVKIVWKTPEKGTAENPKVYQLRLLMDKNDNFYKTMHYHMFFSTSTEKWNFILCPKTYNFSNYCPICAVVSKLYMGSKADKSTAYNLKRKTKYCCNAYVVKDPRDTEKIDEEKSTGKVLIYEFPSKVESKISSEMNDTEYGGGINIFDPSSAGFDFILKVGATKPIQEEGPNRGKTFPDYGDSKFANKPSPLADSDEVIDRVMESRHDLDQYIKSLSKTPEEIVSILKQEFLWELIENEASQKLGIKKAESEEKAYSSVPEEDNVKSPEPAASDDSDEDFLKELDNF